MIVEDVVERAAAQLQYALLNVSLDEFPYPHKQLTNIFDDSTYTSILSNYPSTNQMFPLSDAVNGVAGNPDDLRHAIDLFNERQVSVLEPQKRDYWTKFKYLTCTNTFALQLLNRFAMFRDLHPFKERLKSPTNLKYYLFLQSDATDFTIDPHTQDPYDILVSIIYFPQEGNSVNSGTVIYTPRQAGYPEEIGASRHPRVNFVRIRTAEYKANTGFLFYKTYNSWHGVEPVKELIPRRTMYLALAFDKP